MERKPIGPSSRRQFLTLALLTWMTCLGPPALAEMGGGRVAPARDELDDTQRARIMATIDQNRARLVAEGKLSRDYAKTITNFAWPLRFAAGRTDRDYLSINNFVDQNVLPVAIADYNCTSRTYDGHQGIDIGTWPFTWKKVEEDDVVIVAGAAGTIVNKEDGNPDRSCTAGPESTGWNAVYVQHADGSVAWYGHMKKSSLTIKALGDTVVAGEYLGVVGSSGFSTGPHLHLELYDSGNNLVDPYLGTCNNKSKQVTWHRQRALREPTVNALTVGTALPVAPACPGIETPNATDFVAPGSTVYLTVYVRDQAAGLAVSVRILRPDGSLFAERTSGPGTDDTANSSFWFWSFDNFPNSPGTWTADATISGKTTSKTFQVGGSPAFGAPASAVAMAGSAQTTAPGMTFAAPLRVQVLDAQGRPVPGARVSFTPPATGASAVLESNTALTDASGIASVAAIANSISGSYAIPAAVSGVSTPASIALTNAAASTALTRAPASIDFGGQSMRTTSPAQAVTLTNGSGAALTVSSIAASPSYAVTHDCDTLAAGASCTANVTFTPVAEDALPGALTIQTGAGTQGVVLAGIGERSLVGHYYRSILRRAPDAGGRDFWNAEAARVQALGVNVNEVWFALAGSFYSSAEYLALNRDNAGFVTDLYGTFFNRLPDAAGFADWTGQLAGGMPREVVLASFMFSTEFANFTQGIFGTATTRKEADTVVDFYRGLLGSLPDDGGFNYWLGLFRTAQCQGGTAVNAQVETISSAFATSAQYTNRGRTNAQYVGDLYNAFLRRGGDLGGVQFWIGQVTTGARTRENVRQQFVASPEFQARVAAIIAQGCL